MSNHHPSQKGSSSGDMTGGRGCIYTDGSFESKKDLNHLDLNDRPTSTQRNSEMI